MLFLSLSLNVYFPIYKEMHSTAVYLIGTQPHWNWNEPNQAEPGQTKPKRTATFQTQHEKATGKAYNAFYG